MKSVEYDLFADKNDKIDVLGSFELMNMQREKLNAYCCL